MAKKDDNMWLLGLGVLAAGAIGWLYLTSQKAGANNNQGQQGIAVGEYNPSAPKKEGCGCGMEPETHAEANVTSSVVGTPGT